LEDQNFQLSNSCKFPATAKASNAKKRVEFIYCEKASSMEHKKYTNFSLLAHTHSMLEESTIRPAGTRNEAQKKKGGQSFISAIAKEMKRALLPPLIFVIFFVVI